MTPLIKGVRNEQGTPVQVLNPNPLAAWMNASAWIMRCTRCTSGLMPLCNQLVDQFWQAHAGKTGA